MTLYGITKTKTTAFHPKANGKVEIFIKTLKEHLRILVQRNQKDWPKYLPLICQVYKSLPVSTTKFSPYEILFGAQMRTPLDLARGDNRPHGIPFLKRARVTATTPSISEANCGKYTMKPVRSSREQRNERKRVTTKLQTTYRSHSNSKYGCIPHSE